ncbi:hypothetical protein BD847_0026 [Flavobacterium cutihirudinis]|uniref:Fibronectin type-III domain-containing protein n=1 Tax=Flavobacterium cutihirudinis TaxID=1265740 RepID=A0A3D9FYR8_9FLAO|nr:hypothetical protein [Flavobacterium cutihirudinis]RED26120.1 hypothetical protein BD847_0026 [Flavobacterium cutihirudinis]
MNKTLLNKYYLFFPIFLSLFSCEEILLVPDISKDEVILTAPVNNAALTSSGVTFSWESVKDAEKYQIQIAVPNFEAPQQIILDTLVTKNSYQQQINIGKYEWRVRAVNSAYETAYSKNGFQILNNDDFQNNTVVLITPSNNLISKNTTQKLSWNTVIGATNYQLQILDKDNSLIKEQNSEATFLNFTFEDGTFTWRVRASNGSLETLYSVRSILIDTKSPNTPTLSNPANASSTTNKSINFQWNRTSIPGSTEKDSIYVYNDTALTNLNFKDGGTSPYNKTLTTGTYYWFIKSFDEAGNQSIRSTLFNFTIN